MSYSKFCSSELCKKRYVALWLVARTGSRTWSLGPSEGRTDAEPRRDDDTGLGHSRLAPRGPGMGSIRTDGHWDLELF